MNKSMFKGNAFRSPAGFFLSVLIIVSAAMVSADQDKAAERDDKTLSPYFFVQTDDDNDRLPLKSTAADVTISGVIADVEVTQVYRNEGKNTLEAIYIFPGSTRAAVYAMRMTIGERTIVAKVEEKKAARETYRRALSEGKTASLLEQQRPNVFQMNVGNILPGDEITVKLNYTELLVPEDAVYEFVYPTVVGPRYSNKKASTALPSEKWVANPYLEEGKKAPFTFAFSCRINSGIPIKKITSPSHEIGIEYTGKKNAGISLDTSTATGNRDVVIRYVLAGDKVESGLLMNIGKKEDFFLLMLEPPKRVSRQQIAPREYIFVMDVSGSMNGFPLEVAKTLMEQLLSGLRSNDYFNVVLFAGSNKTFADQSVPYNSATLKRALVMMHRERGAGGTELLPALRTAMALPVVGKTVARSIVVITDGYVSVEKDAFDYIRNNLGKSNVFTFGIGSSVNRHLIEGMARAGMGEPFVALNKDEAIRKAHDFKTYINAPVLTNISVVFKNMKISEVEPRSIPDLFARRPVVLFGKYHGTPGGTITITGKTGDKKYKNEIRVSEGTVSTKNRALRFLWARHQIRRFSDVMQLSKNKKAVEKIKHLGLTYNLLTDYTSFVAVDSVKRTEGKPKTTVKQPLPLPEGVSNNAVGAQAMKHPVPASRRVMKIQEMSRFKKEEQISPELEKLKKQLEKEYEKSKKAAKQPPAMAPVAAEDPFKDVEDEEASEDKNIRRLKKEMPYRPKREDKIDEELQPLKGTLVKEKPKNKREALMEKIRELEKRKRKLRDQVHKKTESNKAPGKGIPKIIARYEKLLANCTVKKSERCADVIYTLGGLYYDKARDDYIRKRESYEKSMEQYERNPEGSEPENPVPDYSQALSVYERLVLEYPDFKKLSEAYYQMGTIYLLLGDLDKTKEVFTTLIKKYPRSPRASGGHFRLSDLCYLDHDHSCAIKHLEKVKKDGVDIQTWEMVHYRKAEVYYNMGEFKKALNLFHTYVEKCDAGLYPKREFRDMALEFMVYSFIEMKDGVKDADKFFKKVGSRSYEPYVLYRMGILYHEKEKCDMAVKALESALNKFPMYQDASFALRLLVECYKKQGNTEMAEKVRNRLVTDYGPGSKWHEKNAGNIEVIEKSRKLPEVKPGGGKTGK